MTNKEIKSWVDKLSKKVQKVIDAGATLHHMGVNVDSNGELYGDKTVCLLTALNYKKENKHFRSYDTFTANFLDISLKEAKELERGFMYSDMVKNEGENATSFHIIGNKVAKRFEKRNLYKPDRLIYMDDNKI